MSNQLTEESFLRNVACHRMEVLLDQGVYRHIRFSRPESSAMHFELITAPGKLIYTGDMGTFVFSRLRDMFEFFRKDHRGDDDRLYINKGYWAEKLLAEDRNGFEEFDPDKFRKVIDQYFTQWAERERETKITTDDWDGLIEDATQQVLNYAGDGDVVLTRAHEYVYQIGEEAFEFEDLFEHRFTKFTYRYIWACYAIAWGIKQWDSHKGISHE